MKLRDQVIFDIREEKFKYLHRTDRNRPKNVDIIDLNKRLNQTRKTNFYTNTKIIIFSFICLGFFALISLKF